MIESAQCVSNERVFSYLCDCPRRTVSVIEEISVRFATPADLTFVQQDRYIPADVVKRKIEWQEVIVAERDGDRIGYARLEYLWSLVPYIALIHVLPEHRRQGAGKAMLRFIEEYVRERGSATLYSSSQVNEPEPQAWHRHVGFEECGIIAGINTGGAGEVFFRKRL
ncbi:MAG TPA: GNAT family N-acetyltransferase [Dehalococcoidales bacterium]|nr:GNAT family N-acetyltransferase [Dehalococcoidales bacterium]